MLSLKNSKNNFIYEKTKFNSKNKQRKCTAYDHHPNKLFKILHRSVYVRTKIYLNGQQNRLEFINFLTGN